MRKINIYSLAIISTFFILTGHKILVQADISTNITQTKEIVSSNEDTPLIYLYPEKETNISIKFINPEDIIYSYPNYTTEWNITATPNGDLTDSSTGDKLYALYYEANTDDSYVFENGFVVKSDESADFLEEKLSKLGLKPKEIEEFIISWLPKLEENEYNLIHFNIKENDETNETLAITPKPNSVANIRMVFTNANETFNIKEQQLTPIKRDGFTVVECGGIYIRNAIQDNTPIEQKISNFLIELDNIDIKEKKEKVNSFLNELLKNEEIKKFYSYDEDTNKFYITMNNDIEMIFEAGNTISEVPK